MSESRLRGNIVKALRCWDAVVVENPVCPGTPDVNYIDGWLELKFLPKWPRVPSTNPILIRHYTAQQRIWLRRRWLRGGRSHLLLQVGREWLVFEIGRASCRERVCQYV